MKSGQRGFSVVELPFSDRLLDTVRAVMKSPPTGMVGFMDPVTELDLATTLEPGTVGQAARASLDRVVDKLRQR